MQKLVKGFFIGFLVIMLICANLVFVSAESTDFDSLIKYLELEEERKQNSIPVLKITSNLNININGGKTETIELNLKNTGGYPAKNILIQMIPEVGDSVPFGIDFLENTNQIDNLNAATEKKIKLQVVVDEKAVAKIYPVKLKYSFFNAYKKEFDGEDTLYLRVIASEQASPKLSLIDFNSEPKTIMENSQGIISATLQNSGLQDATDIQVSITGLSSDGISINNGSSSRFINKLAGKANTPIEFNIATAETMSNGNYPITFKITYKDADKKENTIEQQYFVNVGSVSDKSKANIHITNMQVPTATYTVGSDFKISFALNNAGAAEARNIKVTAKPEDTGVVPKSASIQMVSTLEAGKTKNLEFLFAATPSSISQNYPISFTVEYEDGSKDSDNINNTVSFTQYAGVNIKNVEKDLKEAEELEKEKEDEEKEDTSKNIPKIIINKYQCNPVIVKAGSEFDLTMVYENTHSTKTVRNIKVTLTAVDIEEKTGASIFTPVDSSNTFYIETIPPKGTAERSIRLFAVPDAQPKTYSINVNFEYEDNDDNGYNATELVGINVKQPAKIDMNEISMPPEAFVGQPLFIFFDFYNTGKVTLSNFTIQIDGDFDSDNKKTFYGNIESGYSEYYEASIIPRQEGQLDGKLTISYDDPSGEHFEEVKDFSVQVTQMQMMEEAFMMNEMMMEEGNQGGLLNNKPLLIGSGIVIVIIIAGIVVFLIRRRIKKQKGLTLDE